MFSLCLCFYVSPRTCRGMNQPLSGYLCLSARLCVSAYPYAAFAYLDVCCFTQFRLRHCLLFNSLSFRPPQCVWLSTPSFLSIHLPISVCNCSYHHCMLVRSAEDLHNKYPKRNLRPLATKILRISHREWQYAKTHGTNRASTCIRNNETRAR